MGYYKVVNYHEQAVGQTKATQRHLGAPSLQAFKARLKELGTTWSSGRCPWPWQAGQNKMIFKVPSNPTHSVIL